MATLRLEIVTPENKAFSEDVDMVTLPGSEGELGVYPQHVPLLTTLRPGELRIFKNGRETPWRWEKDSSRSRAMPCRLDRHGVGIRKD